MARRSELEGKSSQKSTWYSASSLPKFGCSFPSLKAVRKTRQYFRLTSSKCLTPSLGMGWDGKEACWGVSLRLARATAVTAHHVGRDEEQRSRQL